MPGDPGTQPAKVAFHLAVEATDRVAAVAGSSLIVIAQLCLGCVDAVLALSAGVMDGSTPG